MVLKNVQCPSDDCAGMTQVTIDSDEEITSVDGYGANANCPDCGRAFRVKTRKQ